MMPRSPSTASKHVKIIITTGDADGIGWEVTSKALARIGPRRDAQFLIWRAQRASGSPAPENFKLVRVNSPEDALLRPNDPGALFEIRDAHPPVRWVETAARACFEKKFDALVTAPLSKSGIIASGLKDIGHTEILARVTGRKRLNMGFIGSKFAVVLATGHRPLETAVNEFDRSALNQAITAARELRSALPGARRGRTIAVVGLNPHAGEGGLLGAAETWMAKIIRTQADLEGPLVPDAAFLPKVWARHSVWVTPYHDQGLIPFKLIHGFTGGVHLTMGLPFVRSSVDHGTAKELFGRNLADPGSMKDAIVTAIRLAKEKIA